MYRYGPLSLSSLHLAHIILFPAKEKRDRDERTEDYIQPFHATKGRNPTRGNETPCRVE